MGQLKLSVLIEAVDRITGPMRKISRGLRIELPSAARIGGAALGKLAGLAVRAGAALGALAGVSFGALTGGAIRTGAKFEQFGAVLETIEGSAAKAQASMRWVENFAKTTPYELDEVMEAFVALRAYGIDPTDGSLKTLGDTASAMNKPLMSAIEMLADAQTGEFERLKEFGVRGSAAGKQVALTYQQAGREVVKTSAKSATAIRENLLGIFDSRFAGAMEKQAGTMKGLWSNLMDMLTSFQRQIADAGLFAFVKGELAGLLTMVNTMAANGQLAAWASQISAGLIELLKSLKDLVANVDWVGVTKGVIELANGFAKFMNMIGGFRGLVDALVAGGLTWITTSAMAAGAALAGILGVAAGPIVAVIAIIGLLAVAGWFVYRSWDKIVAGLGKIWNGLVGVLKTVWTGIADVFTKGAALVWALLPPWFRTVLRGGAFLVRLATGNIGSTPPGGDGRGGSPRPRPAAPGGGQAANGRVGVDVRLHDGRAPTVQAQSSSAQVPVSTAYYRGSSGRG